MAKKEYDLIWKEGTLFSKGHWRLVPREPDGFTSALYIIGFIIALVALLIVILSLPVWFLIGGYLLVRRPKRYLAGIGIILGYVYFWVDTNQKWLSSLLFYGTGSSSGLFDEKYVDVLQATNGVALCIGLGFILEKLYDKKIRETSIHKAAYPYLVYVLPFILAIPVLFSDDIQSGFSRLNSSDDSHLHPVLPVNKSENDASEQAIVDTIKRAEKRKDDNVIQVKRDPNQRAGHANVFWDSDYTLFDFKSGEPIFPEIVDGETIYKIYYSSNEDPRPNYGEFSVSQLEKHLYYKFKTIETCMLFCESKNIAHNTAQLKEFEVSEMERPDVAVVQANTQFPDDASITPCIDPGGREYQTVQIGDQVWMAENLVYEPVLGNYWSYENDSWNAKKYGYLYDWETANKVCPEGWHLPSDAEWNKLINYLGGREEAGNKMKSRNGWFYRGDGTDKSGFSGLPGGYRYFDRYGSASQVYLYIGNYGAWWSSSEHSSTAAGVLSLDASNGHAITKKLNKANGYSIRCILD